MKKVLLGTSAIALAGAFASQANAAEWNMTVGGYMEEQMVYTNTDSSPGTNYDGIDNISDGEIHFKPSITLDNGVKFGVRVELEAASQCSTTTLRYDGTKVCNKSTDQIDENYAYVEGSFGRIVIGEDDNAANSMAYAAPDVGFYNINSGSDTNSLPFAAAFGTTATYPFVESDSSGIRYFTPRMAGFQLGASYAKDANKATFESNQDKNASGAMKNIWGLGANYVNTIGGFSIAASAGITRATVNETTAEPGMYLPGVVSNDLPFGTNFWGVNTISNQLVPYSCAGTTFDPVAGPLTASQIESSYVVDQKAVCAADSHKPTAYAFGLNLGYGGFTVGGSYAKFKNGASATGGDRYVYDLGASYETGPWGFSATFLQSKDQSGGATDGDKINKYELAIDYKLAAGVRLGATGVYEHLDYKASGVSSDSGFVLATGMKLSF